jgi:hypothetical protein
MREERMLQCSCGKVDCVLCALHCPYCGQHPLVVDIDEVRMRCPRCGAGEDLPHPELIESRHRQVPVLSGHSISEWKARGCQLNREFHHRWRHTMNYLAPAASAALSYVDQLMIEGCPEDEALSRAQQALPGLQQYSDAHPEALYDGEANEAYLDDWF